jgi:hypothetical protein
MVMVYGKGKRRTVEKIARNSGGRTKPEIKFCSSSQIFFTAQAISLSACRRLRFYFNCRSTAGKTFKDIR